MKKILRKWKTSALLTTIFVSGLGYAQSPISPTPPPSTNAITAPPLYAKPQSVWIDGIGSGFRKKAKLVGMSIAYAPTAKIMGTRADHDFVVGAVHGGWVISEMVLKDTKFKGNWDVRAEGFGGFQINEWAYLAGLDLFARYNISTGTRIVPFAEIGLGVMSTDIGRPDLGSPFEFNEKIGIGAHVFITEQWAATIGARFMHISNAGLKSPNIGVNSVPLFVGVSYFF